VLSEIILKCLNKVQTLTHDVGIIFNNTPGSKVIALDLCICICGSK